MKLSKDLLGTAFGAGMMALLSTGSAEAADSNCEEIDLTRVDSINETFKACLAGDEIILLDVGDEAIETPEVENRGCEEEYDRGARKNFMICTVAMPRDVAAPEDFDSKSRVGNAFDPDLTLDGRTVGMSKYKFKFDM